MPYFHVVYTLPSELRDIAYQNKRVVYDLLMKESRLWRASRDAPHCSGRLVSRFASLGRHRYETT